MRAWVVILALMMGCARPPQFAPAQHAFLREVAATIAARDANAVAGQLEEVETRYRAGALNSMERDALNHVLSRARAGDWEGAKATADSLAEGQVGGGDP